MQKIICPHCGESFDPVMQAGRNVKRYCSKRCRARSKEGKKSQFARVIPCVICHKDFMRRRSDNIYCSRTCYSLGYQRRLSPHPRPRPWYYEDAQHPSPRTYERVCPQCGDRFVTESAHRRYCSQRCRERYKDVGKLIESGAAPQHKPGAWRKPLESAVPAPPGARLCEVEGCNRRHAAKGLCINHYNRWRRQTGRAREPINGYARSRAEYWGVEYEPIDPAEVYAADDWTCQICGGLVDVEKFHPHPGSPSLDHIVPMSKGGPHMRDNVQTAHLGCNVQKGNRTS